MYIYPFGFKLHLLTVLRAVVMERGCMYSMWACTYYSAHIEVR